MNGKKRKKSVTEQTEKKDRAKHRCPDAVKELINLVNSIPPERKLPYYDPLRKPGGSQKLRALLDGVPKIFLNQYEDVESAYAAFRRMRRVVHELAQYAALPASKREAFKNVVFHRDEAGNWMRADLTEADRITFTYIAPTSAPPRWLEDIRTNEIAALLRAERWPSASLTIEQGRFAVRRDEWITSLIGCEADRLRECEVCQRIFWARMDNMQACTPRCSNARRQRKLRESRAQYEEARKKKRQKAKAGTGRKNA
jgi:hypothetical protein